MVVRKEWHSRLIALIARLWKGGQETGLLGTMFSPGGARGCLWSSWATEELTGLSEMGWIQNALETQGLSNKL